MPDDLVYVLASVNGHTECVYRCCGKWFYSHTCTEVHDITCWIPMPPLKDSTGKAYIINGNRA